MLTSLFYIFLFYFIGELVSYFTGGFIPGSVLGMVFLFLSLLLKIIKPEKVKSAANFMTSNMGVFYVPAGVGLMTSVGVLRESWAVITVVCVLTTLLVMMTVGFMQQRLGNGKSNKK